MAIEITKFNYPYAYANNIHEVHDWLVANASEYFPGGIVKDTDAYTITCYTAENTNTAFIRIPFRPSDNTYFGLMWPKYSDEGFYVNPTGYQYDTKAYAAAAKTNHGFVLLASNGCTWFVTRTDSGSVCTFAFGSLSNLNRANWCARFCDLEHDRTVPMLPRNLASNFSDILNILRQKTNWPTTTLLPVPFYCGTYTPDMFMTPFTQGDFSYDVDHGELQKVLIDGEEYVYDGFIALKG